MDDSTKTVEVLNEIKQSGERVVSSTSEIGFIHGEASEFPPPAVIEEEKQLIGAGYEAFDTNIKRYDEMVGTIVPDDAESLERIKALGSNLFKTSREILALKKDHIGGKAVMEKREEFERNESAFLSYIDNALEKEKREQFEEQKNVEGSIAVATRQTLIVTGLTFLLAILSGAYVSYLISRRIGKLKRASQKVGEGDLDTQIEIDSNDEIGDLSRSFNNMVGDLRRDIVERQRAEVEREIISEIIQGVTSATNLDESLVLIHNSIKKVLYAENCYVALYDNKTEMLSMEFFYDTVDGAAPPQKLGKGMTAHVFHEGRPVLLTREAIQELVDRGHVELLGTPPAVWLGVPLRVPTGIIGVLVVQHYEDNEAYSLRDLDLLVAVGDQIALAIERKLAEDALRENEEKFRELLDNANDVIYTVDMKGNFTSLNRAGEAMSGYSRAEAVQRSLTDIIPPESVGAVYERLALNLQGIPQPNFELEIITKDGSKRTMDVSSRLIKQNGVPVGLQGIGRDITERKRTEAALEESEASFKSLFDTASDAIFVTKKGAFQACNPAAEKLFGCTQEDMLANRFAADFSPLKQPDGRLSSEKAGEYAAATIKGEPQFFEWTHTRLDGTPFDAEVSLARVDVGGVTQIQATVRDITERKRAEEETTRLNAEIASQGERLETIVGNVQGVVWETKTKLEDGETSLRFDFVSDYIETMLGYTVEQCLANPDFWLDVIHPDDREKTDQRVRSIFAGGRGGTVEFRWIASDGHEVWVESRNTIIRDDAGKVVGLRGIAVDITERKSLEEQLTHQALHDPLTKLGNRVLFRDRVEHAINRTRRKHSPIAVLFLDLDNFKSVNDSLGHAAGDELLVSVTERLQASLRASDTPARFGGDEFAVLLEDLEHADQASFIAERIRSVLCAPFTVAGTEVFIGSSIGIAITIDGRETPEELLRNADVAMYMSKGNGKGRYTVFENAMHDVLVKRVRLESDMRSAIEKREFEVYYQPILDLQSERVMGMEALVRWNHPEHGLIPPLDFIPLAEETGLIVPLGKWIMEEACMQAREWQTEYQYGDDLSITINVASRQFQDPSLEETIKHALAKSKLPAQSLILEITESTMLADTESTIKKLTELRKLGIRFAIDDFGTGYSSLSYLQRFPVDILKIDKSFIDKIAMDKEGAAVARAIITMSETLSLRTIAEGIESGDQQSQLQDLGCELGQGFHFARPLRAADMNEFLMHSQSDMDEDLPIISIMANGHAAKNALAVV